MGGSVAIDIDHLRSWIGREDVASEIVSEDLARKYHATMDMPGEAPRIGNSAPHLMHFCLAPVTAPTARLGLDGHAERGGFLPPVPLPRRMWAGGMLTFHHDINVGDRVTRTSRIADVTLKEGHTGALCFVTVEHSLEANGAVVLEERQDIVYREAAAPGSPAKNLPEAGGGTYRKSVRATTPLLFRYSALIFIAHRIHYDRPYATQVEGYPGLVVHGPLQAALLCNFATEIEGRPPKQFSFRGLSPLFEHDDFALHAQEEHDGLKLWTAKPSGPFCMVAQARWA